MFTTLGSLIALLSNCPNQRFAPGKGEYYAGQPGNTAAASVANQRIGTLAIGVLNNSSQSVAINDNTITPFTYVDSWIAEGTTIPAAATRGAMVTTQRNPQGTGSVGQTNQGVSLLAGSTTTVLNLPTSYAPVASALIGLNLTMLSGANAGLSRAISANTTTTITTAAFPSAPVAGDIAFVGGIIVDVRNTVATATLASDYVLQYVAFN